MASKSKTKAINLALQGGGAHGAITWGVIDRLLEDGRIDISAISGTSAGAMNAAILAYGLHLGGPEMAREKLDEFWSEISNAGKYFSPVKRSAFETAFGIFNMDRSMSFFLFDSMTRAFSPYQLNPFDFNPLRDIVEKCIDFEELRKCEAVKIFIGATSVSSGKVRIFDKDEISLDVVMASGCLPYIFKAVNVNGEDYWDGGYMGNPALFPFYYNSDADDIVIVHINPLVREETPQTAPAIMNRVNEISFNSSLYKELRAINFVHRLIDNDWIKDEHKDKLRYMRVHSVRADTKLCGLSVPSKLNVEWDFLCSLKERGRAAADEWLEANFEDIGVKSTVDLDAEFAHIGAQHIG